MADHLLLLSVMRLLVTIGIRKIVTVALVFLTNMRHVFGKNTETVSAIKTLFFVEIFCLFHLPEQLVQKMVLFSDRGNHQRPLKHNVPPSD